MNRENKVIKKQQIIAFCIVMLMLFGSIVLLEKTQLKELKAHAPLMLEAAERTAVAFEQIKQKRLDLGFPIDLKLDPNSTGMIGVKSSDITTTQGMLSSKRSTTNPNIAALFIDFFVGLGLEEGDGVAFNLSGSFPALNAAALIAADVLGINAIVISSIGSSSYGANIPDFTWQDMERHLVDIGILKTQSVAVSLGGDGDAGTSFPDNIRQNIIARMIEHDYTFINNADFEENLSERIYIYGNVKAFVNIGGNIFTFGTKGSSEPDLFGLISRKRSAELGNGLLAYYLEQGVPVIHFLNMRDLLSDNGFPYDPSPLPALGKGEIYYTIYNNKVVTVIAIISIILSCTVLFFASSAANRLHLVCVYRKIVR